MRFALSTLGCPELDLDAAVELAARTGFGGLEVRSAPGTAVSTASTQADRRRWRAAAESTGIELLSVASYVKVCDPKATDEEVVADALAQARLGHDLGARWLRVFAGGPRDMPTDAATDDRGRRRLEEIAAMTSDLGVRLALETHDSHPTGTDVTRLLDGADLGEVQVIWDVLHTWLGGEEPEASGHCIGDRLAYVQVKDVASRDDLAPLALGAGVLPLARCLDVVRQHDPQSWVSWEYERAWHPQAPSLEVLAPSARAWLDAAVTPG